MSDSHFYQLSGGPGFVEDLLPNTASTSSGSRHRSAHLSLRGAVPSEETAVRSLLSEHSTTPDLDLPLLSHLHQLVDLTDQDSLMEDAQPQRPHCFGFPCSGRPNTQAEQDSQQYSSPGTEETTCLNSRALPVSNGHSSALLIQQHPCVINPCPQGIDAQLLSLKTAAATSTASTFITSSQAAPSPCIHSHLRHAVCHSTLPGHRHPSSTSG